jgi:hypothetical protein
MSWKITKTRRTLQALKALLFKNKIKTNNEQKENGDKLIEK